MVEETLTPDRILETAEEVLRRFGPTRATVVDVARALGVSHGSVYRHFPSKAALRDAVTERWLARLSEPLISVGEEDGPAAERLRRWFDLLMATKRKKAFDDPELFATYVTLTEEARSVVGAHVVDLTRQIARILADGVTQGEFAVTDPAVTARAVWSATTRFHNPVHASEWSNPDIDASFEEVWSLILSGLRVRKSEE